MRDNDIYEEITGMHLLRGTMTLEEINDVDPSDFDMDDDSQDVSDLSEDIQFGITDCNFDDFREKTTDEETASDPERSENLVRTYFNSMGNISILTREEEIELSKKLDTGKTILRGILSRMPVYKKLEAATEKKDESDEELAVSEDKSDKLMAKSLFVLDQLMKKAGMFAIDACSQTYLHTNAARFGKKKHLRGDHGTAAAKQMKDVYREIEAETGISIDKLKIEWDTISRARALVEEAKNEFVIHNLRLVINIAKKYLGRGLPLLDLVQEGNIGLMKAAERFKHEKGCKFSTYAIWWIRQSITRALIDQTKTIRVPVHIMEFYNKVIRTSSELTNQLGRKPSNKEIARKMRIPVKRVDDIFKTVQQPLALQTPVGDEDSELEDFVEEQNIPSPDLEAEKNESLNRLHLILKSLPPKEEKVIRMRFGIGADKDHTLDEIGKYFSISRERVRQIELKALRKLKHPSRMRFLKELVSA